MWSRDHGLGLETVSRPENGGLGLGLETPGRGLGLGLGLGTRGLGLGLGLETLGLGLGLGLPNPRSWSRSRSRPFTVLVSVSNLWSRLSGLSWPRNHSANNFKRILPSSCILLYQHIKFQIDTGILLFA
jgi:hypothetical protein